MNRVIKFRAWNGDAGLMVEPSGEELDSLIKYPDLNQEWSVMQFTGLLDKNGVEVYEGDIVRCTKGCLHEMVWMKQVPNQNLGGTPGFYLAGLMSGYSWIGREEILGNIYENPELLKV
jgi:hypothetical protein